MSLRQRQKTTTRRTLQSVAVRLFRARGFDSVSIEEIAAAAEVSPSTVYRHFRTKEDLVLWDEQDAAVAAALARFVPERPPLGALEAALREAYTMPRAAAEDLRRRAELIDSTPALSAHQAAALDRAHGELVAGLAPAYGRRVSPLELDLAVRLALAALLAAFRYWQAAPRGRSLAAWITRCFAAARSAAQVTQ